MCACSSVHVHSKTVHSNECRYILASILRMEEISARSVKLSAFCPMLSDQNSLLINNVACTQIESFERFS